MELYSLVMLTSDDVSYEDGDPAIDDFEVFSSVEKAKDYVRRTEEVEWSTSGPNGKPATAQFVEPTWLAGVNEQWSTSNEDDSYLGYTYIIAPLYIDPEVVS